VVQVKLGKILNKCVQMQKKQTAVKPNFPGRNSFLIANYRWLKQEREITARESAIKRFNARNNCQSSPLSL